MSVCLSLGSYLAEMVPLRQGASRSPPNAWNASLDCRLTETSSVPLTLLSSDLRTNAKTPRANKSGWNSSLANEGTTRSGAANLHWPRVWPRFACRHVLVLLCGRLDWRPELEAVWRLECWRVETGEMLAQATLCKLPHRTLLPSWPLHALQQ